MKSLLLLLFMISTTIGGDTRPNIVLFLADDLGWNDVSWHNPEVVTPTMQALVDSGVLLEQSYVQPVCTPSRSALMTGLYPFRTGRQGVPLGHDVPIGLTLNHTLLPEYLRQAGYSTHMVGKWHLGFCNWAYTPTYRGFDTFYGFYGGIVQYFTHTFQGGYDMREQEDVYVFSNGTYGTHDMTDRVVDVIADQQGDTRPFFLYVPFQNVHSPYEVPDEYLYYYPDDMDEGRRVYLAMVTAMDVAVGRIVAALKDAGLYDNTVIVFSTDNGGSVRGQGNNEPLRGGKGSLWEGGTRGVGFVHSPLLSGTPRVHQGLVHITDWFSTFLSIAGAHNMPLSDGVDQWAALRDPGAAPPRTEFIYNIDTEKNGGLYAAVRKGNYKYLTVRNEEGEQEPWLFDLQADPNESSNLVHLLPDVAGDLEQILNNEIPNVVAKEEPEATPEVADPSLWHGAWSPGWCHV